MEVTAEAVALSAIFLLPGYAAHRLTNYLSRKPPREISTLDTILASLGTTTGILVIEGLLAAMVAAGAFLVDESCLRNLELDVLVRSGLREYTAEQPWVVVLTIGSSAVATTAAAFAWGWFDPVGKNLERRQVERGISPSDIWTLAFDELRTRLGYQHVNASIRLKGSGDVFRGRVKAVSFPSGKNHVRDVFLRHVTYIAGGSGPPVVYHKNGDPRSGALISSNDIESITIRYE